MSQRDLLRLVLSNLSRMRARVALTATGVLIGTAAIVVLISLAAGLQQGATAEIGEFGDLTTIQVFRGSPFGFEDPSQPRSREVRLDARALLDIEALPNAVAVTPQQSLMGGAELKYGRASGYAGIEGVDPRVAPLMGWQLASGEPRLGNGQIVIGPQVFERGGPAFVAVGGGGAVNVRSAGSGETAEVPNLQGRTITAVLTKFDEDGEETTRSERLRVAGVFEEGGQNDYSVYMSLAEVENLNRWFSGRRQNPREGYNQALVKVDDRESVAEVQRQIRQMGFSTFSAQDILRSINQVFIIMQAVLGSIGAVTLLVAAFGIANTMTMAIYERTKEIGIMKAVGATNRDVLRIFLAEAGAIGFLGGLLGIIAGWILGQIIDVYVRTQMQSPGPPSDEPARALVATPLWLVAFALSFATLVGLASGIYPALRAASMKPLRALRME